MRTLKWMMKMTRQDNEEEDNSDDDQVCFAVPSRENDKGRRKTQRWTLCEGDHVKEESMKRKKGDGRVRRNDECRMEIGEDGEVRRRRGWRIVNSLLGCLQIANEQLFCVVKQ